MTYENLQHYLSSRFGPHFYLSAKDLEAAPTVTIEPNPNRLAPAWVTEPCLDGPWTSPSLSRGSPYFSLGEHRIPSTLLSTRMFVYLAVLKRAGEDQHHIPVPLLDLAPIIQTLADYQYQNSPFARTKVCAISLRVLPIQQGVAQIGDGWHIHKPYATMSNLSKRMRFYGSSRESIEQLSLASAKLIRTESYYSTTQSTIIQTQAFARDLAVTEGSTEFKLIDAMEESMLPQRQLNPYELAVGTSHTYHKACIPTESSGTYYRLFMKHLYIPTRETEMDYYGRIMC